MKPDALILPESDELLPLIESTYRADPEHRIIFGQSLGEEFDDPSSTLFGILPCIRNQTDAPRTRLPVFTRQGLHVDRVV